MKDITHNSVELKRSYSSTDKKRPEYEGPEQNQLGKC